MNSSSAALNALRVATRGAHDRLEYTLAVARPDAGRAEYLAYLRALWGWMSPFEESLWAAAWPREMAASARSGKCGWIESDLRSAGYGDAEMGTIAVCGFRPGLGTEAERFGLAYVIEGAQLGSRVLQKRLAPCLRPWEPRWLAGYGDATAHLWRGYTECAERALADGQERQHASRAAAEAFDALASWCAEQGVA